MYACLTARYVPRYLPAERHSPFAAAHRTHEPKAVLCKPSLFCHHLINIHSIELIKPLFEASERVIRPSHGLLPVTCDSDSANIPVTLFRSKCTGEGPASLCGMCHHAWQEDGTRSRPEYGVCARALNFVHNLVCGCGLGAIGTLPWSHCSMEQRAYSTGAYWDIDMRGRITWAQILITQRLHNLARGPHRSQANSPKMYGPESGDRITSHAKTKNSLRLFLTNVQTATGDTERRRIDLMQGALSPGRGDKLSTGFFFWP